MRSICVYCGSSSQVASEFFQEAKKLGEIFSANDIRLIYGAGAAGLMGEIANSALKAGGTVAGVIPRFMYEENWFNPNLKELIVVESMHERKQKMAEMADALVALPGGVGTFEELVEVITWKQLGLITKPIIIVNTGGYYTPLLQMFQQAVDNKFMRDKHLAMWEVVEKAEEVLPAIERSTKWDTSYRKFAAL